MNWKYFYSEWMCTQKSMKTIYNKTNVRHKLFIMLSCFHASLQFGWREEFQSNHLREIHRFITEPLFHRPEKRPKNSLAHREMNVVNERIDFTEMLLWYGIQLLCRSDSNLLNTRSNRVLGEISLPLSIANFSPLSTMKKKISIQTEINLTSVMWEIYSVKLLTVQLWSDDINVFLQ